LAPKHVTLTNLILTTTLIVEGSGPTMALFMGQLPLV
jgi:hypothetical protein